LTVLRRFDEAAHALAEAHPLIESARVPKLLGDYHAAFGFLKSLSEDRVAAREHFEKAVVLYRTCEGAGSEERVLNMLGNLADLNWALGDLDAALAVFAKRRCCCPFRRKRPYASGQPAVYTDVVSSEDWRPPAKDCRCSRRRARLSALEPGVVSAAGDAAGAAYRHQGRDPDQGARGSRSNCSPHRLPGAADPNVARSRPATENASMSEDDVSNNRSQPHCGASPRPC
jgi:hypothetical protein